MYYISFKTYNSNVKQRLLKNNHVELFSDLNDAYKVAKILENNGHTDIVIKYYGGKIWNSITVNKTLKN